MMLGARKPFDPNDPQYAGQVNLGAMPITPAPIAPLVPDTGPALAAAPKHNWIGILADALAGAAGQPGQYAARMARQREDQTAFDRGEQQWRKHHQVDVADQMKLLDYKRSNPDDELSQYMKAAGIDPNSPAGQDIYRQKVSAMTAPPMMSAAGVDEQGNPVMRFFPRAQPVAASGPPPAAVAYLKAHPDQGYAFEQKYGPGSATQYLGGPTPPASGGFPR